MRLNILSESEKSTEEIIGALPVSEFAVRAWDGDGEVFHGWLNWEELGKLREVIEPETPEDDSSDPFGSVSDEYGGDFLFDDDAIYTQITVHTPSSHSVFSGAPESPNDPRILVHFEMHNFRINAVTGVVLGQTNGHKVADAVISKIKGLI